MKSLATLITVVPLWVVIQGAALNADPLRPEWKNLDDVLTTANLRPKGTYYEATVPDTLDLAERARLSVHGLTSFLNPTQHDRLIIRHGSTWRSH